MRARTIKARSSEVEFDSEFVATERDSTYESLRNKELDATYRQNMLSNSARSYKSTTSQQSSNGSEYSTVSGNDEGQPLVDEVEYLYIDTNAMVFPQKSFKKSTLSASIQSTNEQDDSMLRLSINE